MCSDRTPHGATQPADHFPDGWNHRVSGRYADRDGGRFTSRSLRTGVRGGGDPVGFSKEKLDKPPYRFTLQIPRSTRPDKYPIAAAGFTSINRGLLNSHSITVLVERADSPVSLTVYPVIADFTMDQKRYFPVTAFTPIKQRPPYGQEKRPSPTTPQDRGSGSCPGAREVTCSYPLHSSTGNLGYFGKLESTFESWQR